MSEMIPAWALKKLLDNDPAFKRIPPELYDMWRKPQSEADFEEFVSYAKELWEGLSGNTTQKKDEVPARNPNSSTNSATNEELDKVMDDLMKSIGINTNKL